MIENLIISGGAMRGFTFIGAVKYLEEIDIIKNIKTFTGTSIGACLALCLNLDFTSKELIDIFTNIDIDKHRDINLDNVLNFFENYGLDDGTKILNIFKILINAKIKKTDISLNENITFEQLFKLTNKKLTIIGCCLNDMEEIYYNYEKTPNFNIIDALRISFSIPFIFKPIKIENKFYIDGAILNNYPIDLYDKETSLGLVSTNINIYNKEINNIENYFTSIIFITYYTNLKKKLEEYDNNTINLEYNLNSFDFSIDKEYKNKLIDFGYKQTQIIYNNKFNK